MPGSNFSRYLYNGKELQDAAIGNLGLLGLYDFGARYYDPMLGRWFNIDPALQLVNPYLYCGNSPMIYVDKDGRWFGIDDLIAALIGGIVNSVAGLISGDIHSVGHFFASFGAGALAGWGTLYARPVVSGAFLGAANSTLSQGFNNGWNNIQYNSVFFNGVIGGLTGGAASKISGAIAPAMNQITGGIASPVVQQSINQGVTGAATGFLLGTGVAVMQGESFENAMRAGGRGALFGLTVGTVTGVASGIKYASDNGLNPWTGKSTLPPDFTPNGDNITLYRAMSGNEDPNKPLFMTDDLNYAKQYGSNIQKVQIDRYEFWKLQQTGGVGEYRGQYVTSPMVGTEYKITNPHLNAYILNKVQDNFRRFLSL